MMRDRILPGKKNRFTNPGLVAFLIGLILILLGFVLFEGFPVNAAETHTASALQRIPDLSLPSDALDIEVLAHLGGSQHAIEIEGDLVYLGSGPELAILDITDPAAPVRTGYTLVPELITDIEVMGDTAYLAAGDFWIVDIVDPDNPELLSSYRPPLGTSSPENVTNVSADGNFVVFSANDHEIWVLDRSMPEDPQLIDILGLAYYSNIKDLIVSDEVLFVYTWNGRLSIFDLSNPANFREIGSLVHYITNGYGLALDGNLLFLIDSYTLYILDVSDPSNPVQLVDHNTFLATSVAVSGDFVFIGSEFFGVTVLDISDLPSITTVATFPVDGYIHELAVDSDRLFVPTETGCLTIYDFSISGLFTELGGYSPLKSATISQAYNNLVYLSGDSGEIVIFDMGDPRYPGEAGVYDLPVEVNDLFIQDHFLYVGTEEGIQVLDITSPSSPVLDVDIDLGGEVESIYVQGDYAYINLQIDHDTSGFYIVDLQSNPNPQITGWIPFLGLGEVAAFGNLAFFADSNGIKIIDVTIKSQPYVISERALSGSYPSPIIAAEPYVFMANRFDGLIILDVADPFNPQVLATVPQNGVTRGAAYDGSNIYLVSSNSGLKVVDVQNPSHPAVLARYPLSDLPSEQTVAVGDDVILLTDSVMGLYTMRYVGLSIHGQIRQVNGLPYSGPRVLLSDGRSDATDYQGNYKFQELDPGPYTLTPEMSGYQFWPAEREVNLPPSAVGIDYWILPETESFLLEPGVESRLVFTDTQGLPTEIVFPGTLVTTTTAVSVTPIVPWVGEGFSSAYHAFTITPVLTTTSAAPISIDINYSDLDHWSVAGEEQLGIWIWQNGTWLDASETCEPPTGYSRNLDENRIELHICTTGLFQLHGPGYTGFLPMLSKPGG